MIIIKCMTPRAPPSPTQRGDREPRPRPQRGQLPRTPGALSPRLSEGARLGHGSRSRRAHPVRSSGTGNRAGRDGSSRRRAGLLSSHPPGRARSWANFAKCIIYTYISTHTHTRIYVYMCNKHKLPCVRWRSKCFLPSPIPPKNKIISKPSARRRMGRAVPRSSAASPGRHRRSRGPALSARPRRIE